MSNCCNGESCEIEAVTAAPESCPACGRRGLSVDPVTLKALFTPDALRRGVPDSPRFCPTQDCPVVYFDSRASLTFAERDLIVGVHAKHPNDDDVPVCYCFQHSPGTIRREIEQHGSSQALKTITAEVRAAHCACEVKNPKGTCCLADVANVEKDVAARLSGAESASADRVAR